MAVKYIILFLALIFLIFIAYETRKHGFENLKIYHSADKNRVFEGEEFKVSTIIENNKRLPIFYLSLEESVPRRFKFKNIIESSQKDNYVWHISKYSIKWFERKKRTYTIRVDNRGTYVLRQMKATIGDGLGFSMETKDFQDFYEILVYPKVENLKSLGFNVTNFQGDASVKRWIHKDPLYIKGIREYSVEDRMKDIHWKSSLKMNKLMVKDYDFTSERELVVIVNIQGSQHHWSDVDADQIDNTIKVAASLGIKALNEGISTGMWTNSQLINIFGVFPNELKPSLNNKNNLLELCARMDYDIKCEFSEYLELNSINLNTNTTYVIVTSFLDEKTIKTIVRLTRSGYNFKIIDTSSNGKLASVKGIEMIKCRGGMM